jgi:hypothetical protein
MSYLIHTDYIRSIQDANLQQIITSNQSVLTQAERAAVEEAKSHLRQKYDVSNEFQDTNQWDITKTYYTTNRVYLSATDFSATTAYVNGNYVLYSGSVYRANTSHTGAWNPAHFTFINLQYAIYSAKFPYPLFDYTAIYRRGDQVYWKNKTYTCLIPTAVPSHDTNIQYVQIDQIPFLNVFPDDIVNGVQYWGVGVNYSVPANTQITDTAYWDASDYRDAEMVQRIVDITLYHLHQRISPQNIPALRVIRYMGNAPDRVIKETGDTVYPVYSALGWLQACARGFITPNLPVLQPAKGGRIRYGGNPKNINSY